MCYKIQNTTHNRNIQLVSLSVEVCSCLFVSFRACFYCPDCGERQRNMEPKPEHEKKVLLNAWPWDEACRNHRAVSVTEPQGRALPGGLQSQLQAETPCCFCTITNSQLFFLEFMFLSMRGAGKFCSRIRSCRCLPKTDGFEPSVINNHMFL